MGNKVNKSIENGQIDHEVFAVGLNSHYRLGLGHNKAVDKLVSFNRFNKTISVRDINSGDSNILITTTDNRYIFAGNSNR